MNKYSWKLEKKKAEVLPFSIRGKCHTQPPWRGMVRGNCLQYPLKHLLAVVAAWPGTPAACSGGENRTWGSTLLLL